MSKYWTNPVNKIVKCNEELETPVGRAAWVWLTELKPDDRKDKDGKPYARKYSITVYIPKNGAKTQKFIDEASAVAKEMIDLYNGMSSTKVADSPVLKDGDLKDPEKNPNCQGCWILEATSPEVIRVVDGSCDPKTIDAKMVVGGVKVKLLVRPKFSSNGGVGYDLKMVQLVKDDGVRFAGTAKDLTKLFTACEEEEEAGSMTEAAPETPPVEVAAEAQTKKAKGIHSAISKL